MDRFDAAAVVHTLQAPDSAPFASDPADLRRKRRQACADHLVRHAQHLPPADRALIEAVYRDGSRIVEIAALVSQRAPDDHTVRSLRRRIRALVRRMLDPRFDFVVRALGNADGIARSPWSPVRAHVAREHYLNGRTMRDLARHSGASFYSVRRHRDAIEALFEMHVQRSRPHA